jgi:hypothetical protein
MYDSPVALEFFQKWTHHERNSSRFIDAVLRIKTGKAMRLFFEGYVMFLISEYPERPLAKNEKIARSNIGFAFGEGMPMYLREKWNVQTGASHPVFGMSNPSPEEAFHLGCKLGEQMKFEKEMDQVLAEELEELKKKNYG